MDTKFHAAIEAIKSHDLERLRELVRQVQFLIRHGADPRIKDTKIGAFAAGWAEHGGHPAVARYLEGVFPAGNGC